jgi:hypothetical protein
MIVVWTIVVFLLTIGGILLYTRFARAAAEEPLEEGFQTQTIPTQIESLTDLSSRTTFLPADPTDGRSIFIFDPTAVWVQKDIASVEYPAVVQSVVDDINTNCTATNNSNCNYIDAYYWWIRFYSQKYDSLYMFGEYVNTDRRDYKYAEDFKNYIAKTLNQYYMDLLDLFKSHPVGFILANMEAVKTPEYSRIVDSIVDVDKLSDPFSKVKGYMDPGIMCQAPINRSNAGNWSYDKKYMECAGRNRIWGCCADSCMTP